MPGGFAVSGSTMAVRLVAPEPCHAEAWRRWRTDPESRRFMYLPGGGLDEWAVRLAAAKSDLAELYRWIAEVDGTPVGSVAFSYVDWIHLLCEVGYVMAPEARGKGRIPAILRIGGVE